MDDADHQKIVTRSDWAQANRHRELAAVLAQRRELEAATHWTGTWRLTEPGAMDSVRIAEVPRYQHVNRLADELCAVVAEDDLGLPVHQGDDTVWTDYHDRVWRGLHDRAKEALTQHRHGTLRYSRERSSQRV